MAHKKKKEAPEIKFKLNLEPVWVGGDHSYFDNTELAAYTKEQRARLQMLIAPYTPVVRERIQDEHMVVVSGPEDSAKKIAEELDEEQAERIVKLFYALGGMAEKKEPDKEAIQEATLLYVVREIKGFYDENGIAIEGTLENLKILFNEAYPKMGGAVMVVSRDLLAKHELFMRKSEKNLQTSSNGSSSADEK